MISFVWDAKKAEANWRKHGVNFAREATSVFGDPEAITVPDYESDPGEERFISIGMSERARVVVVVYTFRGDSIRIISARQADAEERKEYNEQ